MDKYLSKVFGNHVVTSEYRLPATAPFYLIYGYTTQKNEGLHVNERDIRKHRQHVFRMFPLVNADARIGVSPLIYDDIQHFISEMKSSEFDLKAIHITIEKNTILEIYDSIYYRKPEE